MKIKGIIVVFILIIVVGLYYYIFNMKSIFNDKKGVFSWYPEDIDVKTIDKLAPYGITEVYQLFSDKVSDEEVADYLTESAKKGVQIYALVGEPEWALNNYQDEILTEIERVRRINKLVDADVGIKGIVIDVEPYTLDEWNENSDNIMKSYTELIKLFYDNKESLELYICVPFYYDDLGYESFLNECISQYCDGLLVMNYSVGNESDNIKTEIMMCEKYDKAIYSIYELNAPNDIVKNSNTYFGGKMSDIEKNYKEMKNRYKYKNMFIAYHEYKALIEME